MSLRLDPGFEVRSIGGVDVTAEDTEAHWQQRLQGASTDNPVVVVFRRPAPPLPLQGWARKALRRKARTDVLRLNTRIHAMCTHHAPSLATPPACFNFSTDAFALNSLARTTPPLLLVNTGEPEVYKGAGRVA